MMASWRSTSLLATLVFAVTFASAALAQQENKGEEKKAEEKKPEPSQASAEVKKVRINEVVRDLAKEGRDEMTKSQSWPRKESDYAQKNNLEADNRDLLQALGRRLDRNEALDGYIKWQLLSFNPNFEEAGAREWQAIVTNLPPVVQRAQPNPTQRRLFAAAEANPNERNADRLREIVAEWEKETAVSLVYSTPAVKYRDAVIKQIPEAGGTRMQVRIMDIQDRYVAGHDSFANAVKDLMADAKRLKDDPKTLPPDAREAVLAKLAQLRSLKNPMIEDVNLMASGAIKTVPFPGVFRGKDYETLTDALGMNDGKNKKK